MRQFKGRLPVIGLARDHSQRPRLPRRVHVERQHEVAWVEGRPDAQIDRAGAHHPAEVHTQAFARTARCRPRQVLTQPVRCVGCHRHDRFAKTLDGRAYIVRLVGQVMGKERLDGLKAPERPAQVFGEPQRVERLKSAVFERGEAVGVAAFVKVVYELVGAVVHPLAEVGHLLEDRRASSPGQDSSVKPNDFLIARIVEAVRDGDGVVVDEGGLFELRDEAVEVGFEGYGRGHAMNR